MELNSLDDKEIVLVKINKCEDPQRENDCPTITLVNQILERSHLHRYLISFSLHLFNHWEPILPWIPRNSVPCKQNYLHAELFDLSKQDYFSSRNHCISWTYKWLYIWNWCTQREAPSLFSFHYQLTAFCCCWEQSASIKNPILRSLQLIDFVVLVLLLDLSCWA